MLLHVGIFNKYIFSFIYRSSANVWTFCQQYVLVLPADLHVLEDADWPDQLYTHTHTHTHALVFMLVHTHLWLHVFSLVGLEMSLVVSFSKQRLKCSTEWLGSHPRLLCSRPLSGGKC